MVKESDERSPAKERIDDGWSLQLPEIWACGLGGRALSDPSKACRQQNRMRAFRWARAGITINKLVQLWERLHA